MFYVYMVLYEIFRNIAITWMNLFYKNTCVHNRNTGICLFVCHGLPDEADQDTGDTGSNPAEAYTVQRNVLSKNGVQSFTGHSQGTQAVDNGENGCEGHCRTIDFRITFKDAIAQIKQYQNNGNGVEHTKNWNRNLDNVAQAHVGNNKAEHADCGNIAFILDFFLEDDVEIAGYGAGYANTGCKAGKEDD